MPCLCRVTCASLKGQVSKLGCCLAGVKRLAKMGMVDGAPGMSALDMNTAEDMVVRNTREVVPGMIICGMEVSLLPSPWVQCRMRLSYALLHSPCPVTSPPCAVERVLSFIPTLSLATSPSCYDFLPAAFRPDSQAC